MLLMCPLYTGSVICCDVAILKTFLLLENLSSSGTCTHVNTQSWYRMIRALMGKHLLEGGGSHRNFPRRNNM